MHFFNILFLVNLTLIKDENIYRVYERGKRYIFANFKELEEFRNRYNLI